MQTVCVRLHRATGLPPDRLERVDVLMNEVVPPNVSDQAGSVGPERCRQILLDILSPRLSNGEVMQAERLIFDGSRNPNESYYESVVAAARWAFQTGELQIVLSPGLRLVQ